MTTFGAVAAPVAAAVAVWYWHYYNFENSEIATDASQIQARYKPDTC